MTIHDPKALLTSLFQAAVAAADPMTIVPRWLPEPPRGRTIVIGAGKASAAMALAFERAWDHPLEGVVVTRYSHGAPCERIRVLEAAHPEPDVSGLEASLALCQAVRGLTADDLVVALISGGGSALLPAPPAGLTLDDELTLNTALLESGLPIADMNLIRKHVSVVKGGRLAVAAAPARVVTLAISDIPGDDISLIASGPTIASPGTRDEALALVRRSGLAERLPHGVLRHLESSAADAPRPDDPRFVGHDAHVIASAALSLASAAALARDTYGVDAVILSDSIEGEARDIGRMHAAIAREAASRGRPWPAPILILSGGETTVTSSGRRGRGGRNTTFALSAAIELQSLSGAVHGLSADTDGIDGSAGAAGAFFGQTTATRLRDKGLDPRRLLDAHDSASAFAALDDLLITGPTQTNVNDFRALLVTHG